ncbi:class I SAM-dependent methyltransferase [Patescibacteria group bacterium]|nr:class I SAM-dependent methyltransferase [Patescibacteria group bacterium]
MTIKCRSCNSSNTNCVFNSKNIHGHHYVSADKFTIYFCRHCHTYFLDNIEKQTKYYSRYYQPNYYQSNSFLTKILMYITFTLKKIRIQKHFKKPSSISILDIGCGQGEFLSFLPNNFKKYGVEINKTASKKISAYGIKIFTGDINTTNFGSTKFDCVTMWHVLEHLPRPQLTLKKINRLLKPGGVLLFSTPNSQSLGFKYGQKHYFHLDFPRHLFIPCQKSLAMLLKTSGFSKYKFSYPFYDFPLDLFWSLRHSLLKYLVYPFYPLFKLLSPETLLTTVYK